MNAFAVLDRFFRGGHDRRDGVAHPQQPVLQLESHDLLVLDHQDLG
ncbi:MAG TPA: hypothetical protein VF516_18135 [Kofleriaceae bacterium]